MALPTPPNNSAEAVNVVVHQQTTQQPTPPRTPPGQEDPMQAGTQMSPVPTTELTTSKGKTIVIRQGGKLYETPMDSDNCRG